MAESLERGPRSQRTRVSLC